MFGSLFGSGLSVDVLEGDSCFGFFFVDHCFENLFFVCVIFSLGQRRRSVGERERERGKGILTFKGLISKTISASEVILVRTAVKATFKYCCPGPLLLFYMSKEITFEKKKN